MASGTTANGIVYPIGGIDPFEPAPDMGQLAESVDASCLAGSTGISVGFANSQPGWNAGNSVMARRGTTAMATLRVSYSSTIQPGRVDFTVGQITNPAHRPISNTVLATLEGDKGVLETNGILRITQVEIAWTANQQRSFIGTFVTQSGAALVYDEPLPIPSPGPDLVTHANRRLGPNSAQSINANSAQLVTAWAPVAGDDGNQPNGITLNGGRCTVGMDGVYHIAAALQYSSNSTGMRECQIWVNGTQENTGQRGANASNSTQAQVSMTRRLAAGDIVDVRAYHSAGAALTVANNGMLSYFDIARIGS